MTMSFFDGRGRWYRYDTRSTVGDYLRLDAQAVGRKADGAYIWRWSWSNWLSGEHHAEITVVIDAPLAVVLHYRQRGEQHEQKVRIRRTPTHNGGSRLDWYCPRCGRPARYLYGAPFACRTCHNLAYPSQQASHEQAGRYAVKRRQAVIRRKLKMHPDAETLPSQRPSGVRWRTWLRLSEEFRELRHVETEYTCRMIYSGTGPALYAQIGLSRDQVMPYLTPASDMAGYRMRKRAGVYEPDEWLVSVLRQHQRRKQAEPSLTIHQLAKQAGVPLDFAREAEQAGLLRPDRDRGRRWPKYRPKLVRWLVKLATLRADGLTWPEISDWSKRRWQTGELVFPGKR